ncbi:MAG: hypothetical protein ABI459_07490 [Deltaproteobacteria bacterium]
MWAVVGRFLLTVVASLVASLFAPKQKVKAAGLEDFDIPHADEGDIVGKPYGSPWIKGPQIGWHGDFKAEAIHDSGGKK